MTMLLSGAATALLALQPNPAPTEDATARDPIASLDELPIQQAASMRCGVAFAVVGRWQNAEDERARDYPDMQTQGGREFFVQSFASLIVDRGMTGDEVRSLVLREVEALEEDDDGTRVQAMMPACLMMKESAGL